MNILSYIQHGDIFLLKIINTSLKCKFLDIIMPLATYLSCNFLLVSFCLFSGLNPDPQNKVKLVKIKLKVGVKNEKS